MNTGDAFWERVHETLDARRDPLDDERVQRELESAPELLDELATLRVELERLRGPRPSVQRSFAWKRAAAAAIVLVAGALVARFVMDSSRSESDSSAVAAPIALAPIAPTPIAPTPGAAPTATSKPRASVLAFHVTLVDESPTERVVTEFDGQTTTVSRELFGAPRTSDSSPSFFASLTTHVSSR